MATATSGKIVKRKLQSVRREFTEMMDLNQRDDQGRIIVRPHVAGVERKTGEVWYVCTVKCGFATLSANRMVKHWKEHEHAQANGGDRALKNTNEHRTPVQNADIGIGNHDVEVVDAQPESAPDIRSRDQQRNLRKNREEKPIVQRPGCLTRLEKRRAAKPKHAFVQCTICCKVLTGGTGGLKHMESVHSDRAFPCGQCPIWFKSKYSIKRHAATAHTGTGKYACRFCSCTFPTLIRKRWHAAQHHSQIIVSNKARRSAKGRNRNGRSVEARNRQGTSAEGRNNKGLKRGRSAKGRPRTKLPASTASTSKTPNKNTKTATNPGRNKADVHYFQCNVCHKRFSKKKDLRMHFQSVHPGLKWNLYKCDHCGMVHASPSSLQKHNEVAHSGGTYPCELCSCTFVTFTGKRCHEVVAHKLV